MKWKIWKFEYLKDIKVMKTAKNIYGIHTHTHANLFGNLLRALQVVTHLVLTTPPRGYYLFFKTRKTGFYIDVNHILKFPRLQY